MILLYCSHEEHVQQIRLSLSGAEIVTASTWRQLERSTPTATCTILAIEWLHRSEDFRQFRTQRASLPLQPVILVTRADVENLRLLKDIVVDEVIWFREMERELASAVQRASAPRPLDSLARTVERAGHLHPKLQEALAYACRATPPVRTVGELAGSINRDRTTLGVYWRTSIGSNSSLRLQDFLDWILLLHATGQRATGRKWVAIAHELGVHEHTLRRIADRRTGCSLVDITRAGQDVVAHQFNEEVFVSLFLDLK